jgi:hypothetical protein
LSIKNFKFAQIFSFMGELDDEARSIDRQDACLPSEVRARHGESSTGLAGDSEA